MIKRKRTRLPRIQKHISSELDTLIKRHQKNLQREINFSKGKNSAKVSYILASRNLARKLSGGVQL